MARTVEKDVINVLGRAQGDGVGDDTEPVQSAFDDAAATGKTVYFPNGNYKCGALDALRVKNIRMDGYITSTVTSGYGILIGTETNANTDMVGGTIQLRIIRSSNSGAENTDGIRIRGMAHAHLRLIVQGFDVGVAVRPAQVATQYVSFNSFDQIYAYGCRTGLLLQCDLEGSGAVPFINENTWSNIVVTEGNNALSGDAEGIVLTSGNNNLFIKPQLESLAVPIWIKAGTRNKFMMCRLESAGNVLFGDGTTTNVAGENIVTAAYAQLNLYAPAGTQQSPSLNFCLPESGPIWTEVYVGSATEVIVPVVTGDIVDLDVGVTGSPANYLTVTALDASQAALATLASGQMPYIGSLYSSFANSTSGTANLMTINSTHYALGERFVGPLRSEVKYLKIETVGGVSYSWLAVRKLVGNMGTQSNPIRVGG